jgi:hypothetical protein
VTAHFSLAADAFSGGLDLCMLAAALPPGAEVSAMTFGSQSDSDCVLAARIARLRGVTRSLIPFDPSRVSRFAAETAWLLEGRLTPCSISRAV